jgi:hypothetical protein
LAFLNPPVFPLIKTHANPLLQCRYHRLIIYATTTGLSIPTSLAALVTSITTSAHTHTHTHTPHTLPTPDFVLLDGRLKEAETTEGENKISESLKTRLTS